MEVEDAHIVTCAHNTEERSDLVSLGWLARSIYRNSRRTRSSLRIWIEMVSAAIVSCCAEDACHCREQGLVQVNLMTVDFAGEGPLEPSEDL